jgi:hypothetical protein
VTKGLNAGHEIVRALCCFTSTCLAIANQRFHGPRKLKTA